MPSYARKHQIDSSLIYHIYNRSNKGVAIFHEREDYERFKQLLTDYRGKFGYHVHHWVIMPNHYHLLLEIASPEAISKLMAGINRAYSHYYYKTYTGSGYLWQGRFKMQPVQKEQYLLACARYIERNPIRVHLAVCCEDYPYSSAAFYCKGNDDGLTHPSPALAHFGASCEQRQKRYREFLAVASIEEESVFVELIHPVGNKEFIARLIKGHGRYVPRRRGRPRDRIVL